jgi:hypothetical protein
MNNYLINLANAILNKQPTLAHLRRNVKDDYIRTLHKRVYILNPQPDDFIIEDIAHALSMTCRFNGYTNFFYSVAQHCVLGAEQASCKQSELEFLMHDRSEGYLADFTTPAKKVMPQYSLIEDNFNKQSAIKFGLPHPPCGEVKYIDKRMLITEASQLFDDTDPWWTQEKYKKYNGPYDIVIRHWSPAVAKRKFLNLYYRLEADRQKELKLFREPYVNPNLHD